MVRKREERPFPLLLGATIVAIILIFSVRQLTAPRRTGYRSITPMHIDISNPDSYTGGIHTPGKPAAPAAVPWPTTRPEPEMLPPPTPTPEPEETPEHFNGPHARIRSHSSMFDAQSVVAFYYPKNNSVALGFFPMQLSASELEVLKKRGVLGNAGGHQRPLMTMYLDFQQGTGDASVKSLRDYTINFYQDAMLGFTFDSVNDAVSFSKTAEQILAEDKIELSGVLRPGGTIHFAIRGKGAPRSNQKLRFRWDIDHEAVLLGTN